MGLRMVGEKNDSIHIKLMGMKSQVEGVSSQHREIKWSKRCPKYLHIIAKQR